jgi:hypothetical protein
MSNLFGLLFVCMASVSIGWGEQPRSSALDPTVIVQREQQRIKTLVARDYDRFEKMTSPTLTYSHSNGTVQTREQYVGDLRAGRLVVHNMNHRDLQVRYLTPDVAILNGISDLEITSGGQDQKIPLRFTIVYVRSSGEWLFEAWHSSRRAGE